MLKKKNLTDILPEEEKTVNLPFYGKGKGDSMVKGQT